MGATATAKRACMVVDLDVRLWLGIRCNEITRLVALGPNQLRARTTQPAGWRNSLIQLGCATKERPRNRNTKPNKALQPTARPNADAPRLNADR